MLILFPKRKGVKIATTLIFEAMGAGASYYYVLGMIDFAKRFGAITSEEAQGITEHLIERDKIIHGNCRAKRTTSALREK